MSRFFRRGGDSDSESEDSDEELMSSDDEEAPPPTKANVPVKGVMSRFLKKADGASSSSSSDEDEDEDSDDSDAPKKADRAQDDSDDSGDEVTKVVKSAKDKRLDEMEATGKAIENGLKINDWVAITNEFDKLARMVQRQNNVAEPIPPFYIRTLISMDISVDSALTKAKSATKKMNGTNAKALNSMKQKLKKASKEYEKEIKLYQDDSEAFEQAYLAATRPHQAAPPRQSRSAVTRVDSDDEVDPEPVDTFTTVGKGGKAMQFTADSIFKTLQQIQEARGKKNTDRTEQIKILEKLLEVAITPYQKIRVLLALVSSRFDYNSSVATHMPIDLWLSAASQVDLLINIIIKDRSYAVEEVTEEYDELAERSPSDEKDGVVRIRGSIISFIDRLDDEFTKSLQNIDPHGTEYIDRLKDEKSLYCIICRAEAYYEAASQAPPLARVIMRRLEHIYSKPDAVIQALEAAIGAANIKPKISLSLQRSSTELMKSLCIHLYQNGTSLLRTRAMLSQIYHYALQNDFHTARDMLLMSHLQETIHSADVATQILYNRTVVQLGLCAFRSGLIKETQLTLQDIFATQRVKELLAQGMHQQRFQQSLSPEQEKAERQRQLPFHMHINTELLEAVFLVSSMLVEIPILASIDSDESKRKAISKSFRRLLDFADRQVFTGPPESTRDHIMQASKALQDGEWETCRDLIQSIKIWSLMPEASSVKEMLAKRIQEQGLRTYLFTYAPHYSTLSLSLLARTFALPLRSVTSIVSKMIWNEEISASLDHGASVVIFHRAELSLTQQMAQIVAEKVSNMVEQSEKTLDAKLGGPGGWSDRADVKGEKRGEQTERRGRSDRPRGGSRGGRGRGSRFAQGLGGQITTH